VAIAQFSSLQHEVLHGHPFRSQAVNEALVFPGLTLFVPYVRFRDLHLAHHHDPKLTDPYDDPESNYQDPAVWARMPGALKAILRLNNTLLGRVLIGPAIGTVSLVHSDLRAAGAGDRTVTQAWVLHGLGVALVLAWLLVVGSMPLWAYVVAAYAAFGVLKIRTFLEHRAHEAARARTVIIEDRGPLALLFLNNNLHVVHHMHPSVPWYRLPETYRANREHYLRRNEGYLYRSYAEIIGRYLLRAKDPVPHPLWPEAPEPATASRARTQPAE
jgi:fatty acid desaturase